MTQSMLQKQAKSFLSQNSKILFEGREPHRQSLRMLIRWPTSDAVGQQGSGKLCYCWLKIKEVKWWKTCLELVREKESQCRDFK